MEGVILVFLVRLVQSNNLVAWGVVCKRRYTKYLQSQSILNGWTVAAASIFSIHKLLLWSNWSRGMGDWFGYRFSSIGVSFDFGRFDRCDYVWELDWFVWQVCFGWLGGCSWLSRLELVVGWGCEQHTTTSCIGILPKGGMGKRIHCMFCTCV